MWKLNVGYDIKFHHESVQKCSHRRACNTITMAWICHYNDCIS